MYDVRRRSRPGATAGTTIAFTNTPRSRIFLQTCIVFIRSPMKIGTIGVSEPEPTSRPCARSPLRIFTEICLRRSRSAGSVSMMSREASAAATLAGVMLASVAAALASLDIIETEPALRDRLKQISVKMRSGLRAQGLEVGSGSETPIVPIFIGDRMKTMQVWRKILDRGVFVNAIVVPAVAPGRDLLRTSYMASHRDEQLDYILKVVGEVHHEVGLELASKA